MSEPHRYKVIWNMEHNAGGLTKEEIPKGWGGSDGLLFVSVMGRSGQPEPYDMAFSSLRGETGKPMEPSELFQLWTMLAKHLAEDVPATKLKPWQREIAAFAIKLMRAALGVAG